MVQRALGILVVGVIISVGGMIFMSVNMSANTTGWNANTVNMYTTIVPLVIFAGWILVVIAGAFLANAHSKGGI